MLYEYLTVPSAGAGRGVTRVWLRILTCAVAILISSGCGRAASPSHTGPTVTGETARLPLAITAELDSIRGAYAGSDWGTVRADFSDPSAASSLVDSMHLWQESGTANLRLSVLSWARLDARNYEVTVQFSDDPRASPDDRLYTVHLEGRRAEISGLASGVRGTSFTTATWTVTRTAHFTVYHSPYQLAGQDAAVLKELESQRLLVARRFHVALPAGAAMYLFPNLPTMRALTHGACGNGGEIGCTSPFTRPPSIEALRPAVFHEAIHVYQLAFVPPSPDGGRTVFVAPLFIAEGMAVALQNPQVDPSLSDYCSLLAYRPLDFCARIALHRVHPTNILADRGFSAADPADAYSLGGSFVSFLLRRHGFLAFKHFYYTLAGQPRDRLIDYNVAARSAYQSTMLALLRTWANTLCMSCSI